MARLVLCTVMSEWHRKSFKRPLKISIDVCQTVKIPWEVYEDMLISYDCNVSEYLRDNVKYKVGSILLMPCKRDACKLFSNLFKVTFTEAELLLTADLSDHHMKCYKILKYVTNPEIKPLQTSTSKIKDLFQDQRFFPSYALKIYVWNHH